MSQTTTADEALDAASPPVLTLRKKILFSLVFLLLLFLVAEVASNVYLRVARGYAGGEFLQYEFDAYKNIGLQRNWVDTRGVRHNSQGFRRDGDVERKKPTGTYRVFLMGASTAYGLGGLWPHLQREYEVLDNSETIDAYLEPMLREGLGLAKVEVINAAVPSIWTHHHLINLNQTVLGFEPDLILFLDGWNDHFFYEPWHDQFASYAHGEQAGVIMGPPTTASLLRMNGWWLFRKSAFVHVLARLGRELKPLLGGGGTPTPIDVPAAIAGHRAVFERSALKMIERNALILRQEGIPAIFMLQPILALERERTARMPAIEKQLFDFNIAAWRPGYEEYMRAAAPHVAKRIEEVVTPLGGRFLDLTSLFTTSEGQIFTDYAHLTPEGNRMVARRIADEIIRMRVPPAPKR